MPKTLPQTLLAAFCAILAAVALSSAFPCRKGGGVMVIAAHHSMMQRSVPSVFRYVGFKFFNRGMRSYSSFSAWASSTNAPMFQIMKIRLLSASGSEFDVWNLNPGVTNYVMSYGGRKMQTGPEAYRVQTWTGDGMLGNPHYPTPTGAASGRYNKQCTTRNGSVCRVGSSLYAALYDIGVDMHTAKPIWDSPQHPAASIAPETTAIATALEMNAGSNDRHIPFCCTLDFGSKVFDVSMYTQWKFWNAGDNASLTGRTWTEGEVIASVDGKTWWRLDVFNDLSIPNTNNALAYTGSLVPRKGDLWSDLDMRERNWTTGISVD